MKKSKFILFLLAILLCVLVIVSNAGCKGKKSKAVTEEAPHALEEGLYDPCIQDIEE